MHSPRSVLFIALALASVCLTAGIARAQNKTIVLVRHAERADDATMTGDPDISAPGRERARHLVEVVKKYKPHEIFSTNYKRTRETAEPIAAYRHKQVQIYDASKPQDLIDHIMKGTTDHFLIVGHSNTIPGLVNLIFKHTVFQSLEDDEYSMIWVIRIRKGVAKEVKVLTY